MILKQIEMDGIVSQIYEAQRSKDHLKSTIFVLLGDHGMNEAGNHGASSPGETSPALIFISPKLKTISTRHEVPTVYREDFKYYSHVDQSDIVPTLAALLGFPIPMNNIGTIIPQFLSFWPAGILYKTLMIISDINIFYSGNQQVQIHLQNLQQIFHLIKATFLSFHDDGHVEDCENPADVIHELVCQWRVITESMHENDEDSQKIQAWQNLVIKVIPFARHEILSCIANYFSGLNKHRRF